MPTRRVSAGERSLARYHCLTQYHLLLRPPIHTDANQFKSHFETAQKAHTGGSSEAAPSTDGGKTEDAAPAAAAAESKKEEAKAEAKEDDKKAEEKKEE